MVYQRSSDTTRSALGITLVISLVVATVVLVNVALSIDRGPGPDSPIALEASPNQDGPPSLSGDLTRDEDDQEGTTTPGQSETSTTITPGPSTTTGAPTSSDPENPTSTTPSSTTTTPGMSTSTTGRSTTSTSTSAPSSTSTTSGATTSTTTPTHGDLGNNHSPLLTGHGGWGNLRIGSHAEPKESTSGPFPNIGTFRVFCHLSHQNYDDPLVFPGVVNATHLHSFFGNKNTRANSTASSIRNGGNSTCQGGTADRSAYWIPSVYDMTAKKLVRPTFAAVYYQSGFGNWVDPAAIEPIPTGLMILAGRSSATPDNPVSQQAGYWGCFPERGGAPRNIGPLIPTGCGSGEQVTLIVNFPQCWDGRNLDSANHASHMAYPRQGCPASHPVVIPRIMLQVIFPVESHGIGGWSLTSDNYPITQRGGASIHADFVNGWDTGIMGRWMDNCIRAVKDCERSELGGGQALTFEWGSADGAGPPMLLGGAFSSSGEVWDPGLLGTPDPENPITTTDPDDFSILCDLMGHRFDPRAENLTPGAG